MRGNKKVIESKSRQNTTIHLSPIAQAVRTALAVSAIALAGTGPVFAGGCHDAPQTKVIRCTVAESANAPIVDLTSVADRQVPTSVMTAHAFDSDASDITRTADASGIAKANASAFSVDIVNNGTIDQSGSGDVVGIDAEFGGADITIVNGGSGDIHTASTAGLADGVFAYGADITVNNRGTIEADGYTWAAGVETQGDSVTINNNGDISATATAYATADPDAGTEGIYGHAYGVYAVGYSSDGVVINNRGTISATGPYATGVYAYDGGGGGIGINNRGDITATADNGYAAGIKTVSNLGASDTDVSNRGSITATGMNGASGIAVNATGLGSSASVDNRGDIYAASTVYYSIAEGIAVSTDGDASIRNRGSITIGYGDYAYGGLALAFAGDADIDNAGDVSVNGGLQAYGFVAASQNGQTSVRNDGAITTDSSFGNGIGIGASSLTGTEVRNDGVIDATGNSNAVGVLANASQGDSLVDNRGSITTDGKYSFGVLAQSVDGDALVDNRGDITGAGKYAYGVVAGSTYGDSSISNAKDGTITGYSSQLLAVGTFANASAGSATIDNRGTINAQGTTGAQLAYGAVVQTVSGDGLVDNRGSIDADNSYGAARGVIVRSSGGGGASVVNRGDISAVSTGSGVYEGYYGTYDVNTDVVGVYASAPGAEATVTNSGSITANTEAGQAHGVFASAGVVEVTNSGSITANGYTKGAGIQASSDGDVAIDNSGSIAAYGQGYAFGIYAQTGTGLASITNTADIHADSIDADAIGIYGGGVHGDVALDNAAGGSISAHSTNGTATALAGASYYGNVAVSNAGVLDVDTAHSDSAGSFAIGMIGNTFSAHGGDVELVNASSGSISATADNTAAKGLMALSYYGDVGIVNAGDITASGSDAIGTYVYSVAGMVNIDNSGSIAATSENGLADGVFAAGAVTQVDNSGSITANGYTWGTGIEAQGSDAVHVTSTGDITASATAYAPADPEAGTEAVYGHAYGIYVAGGDGGVSVDNRGTIAATGAYANGIYAYDYGVGGIGISNRGDIDATAANGIAHGISALTNVEYSADIDVGNRGNITASGYNAAAGIMAVASGAGSAISASNDGAISTSTTDVKYGNSSGMVASAEGDVDLRNGRNGSIHASGAFVYGAMSLAFAGDSTVVNAGDITADALGIAYAGAYGIVASSQAGSAEAINTGNISVTVNASAPHARGIDASGVDVDVINRGSIEVISYNGKYSRGINAVASFGDVAVRNQGSIYVGGDYTKYGYGVAGISTDGDVRITNAPDGLVSVYYASSTGVGLLGKSTNDDVDIVNAGDIVIRDTQGKGSTDLAAGVYASSGNNDVSVVNRGTINADARFTSIGILSNIGGDDELSVDNRGTIHADSRSAVGIAEGIEGSSQNGGDVMLRNRGTIVSSSTASDEFASASAFGMAGIVAGGGELTLANTRTGSITVTAITGDATGLYGRLTDSDVTVDNAGSIAVSSTDGTATAIRIESGAPLTTAATAADNGDHLVALSAAGLAATTEGAAKASGQAGTATIRNSGSLVATSETGQSFAVYGSNGAEKIFNSGTIQGAIVTNGGDDSLVNLRHGQWQLSGTGTDFGAGDDSFTNARGATLELADADITFGAGDNRFQNMGKVKVSGTNHIDMTGGHAGAAGFVNNGVIDFTDGAADDSLAITGGFRGNGAINLDVSLDNKLSDHLSVQGNTARGTHQVVNVALLDGLPKSSDVGTRLQLVHVSGDTPPSAFVAGRVLGVSPRDFLSMGLTLSTKPDATTMTASNSGKGSSYMLGVETYVSGLNASGVLASSTAMAVDSLMNSTMGNHGGRAYMYMAAPGKQSMSGFTPWVRSFNDQGGMNPDHMASNFGQMANSDLNQDNHGTQMGMEYRVGNGFRFGTMFAKSEGQQYLVNDRGRNRILGHSMGFYGSWMSPKGFYVDASWRSMQFQSYIDSIGGHQRSEGHAVGTRLEFGRAWKLGNGLTIAPRMRYTATTVDGLNIDGYQATFKSQDTHWKRASVGVSLQKTFMGATGWQWTPFGEANVVQTLDGVTSYAINQDYFGQVMTKGTSEQMKLGLRAQKGKLSWGGGVNWLGGGNVDGGFGTQLTLRYSW